ncbi:MAG: hypothetical protein ACJA14_000171, partial [Ilumatobacter sp.]
SEGISHAFESGGDGSMDLGHATTVAKAGPSIESRRDARRLVGIAAMAS